MDQHHSLYIYTHHADKVELAHRCSRFLRPGEAFCTLLDDETQRSLERILRETGNDRLIWEKTFGMPYDVSSHRSPTPEELSAYLHTLFSKAQHDEYKGLCLVIDMASMAPVSSTEEMLRIEETLESLLHLHLRCICLYPRSVLSRSFLAQLEQLHVRTGFSESFAKGFHIYTAEPEAQETMNVPSFHSPSVRKALLHLAYSGKEGWEAFQRIGNKAEPPRLRIAPPGGHDMVWTTDKHFRLSYLSPELQRFFGVSFTGIPGAPLSALLGEELTNRLAAWEAENPEASSPWPPRIHYHGTLEAGEKGLEKFVCTAAPILFDQWIIGYTGEINILAESPCRGLHYEEAFEKMRPLWEGLPLGVAVIDDTHRVLFSNASFSQYIAAGKVPAGSSLEELNAFHGSSLNKKLTKLDFDRSHYHHIYTSFHNSSGYHIKTSVQVILLDSLSYQRPRFLCIFFPEANESSVDKDKMSTAASVLSQSSERFYYGTAKAEELLTSAEISHREREIISLLLRGYRNREIGEGLNIAEITVKKHLTHIYRKIGVKNRFDLIRKLSSHPSS